MGRILITGAEGQLGRDATRVLGEHHEMLGLGKTELDVTKFDSVEDVLGESGADFVLHLAALTHVDEAERVPDEAYLVNAIGTRNIARAAQRIGAKLIYVSTDYVFSGQQTTPYTEFDPPCPINCYGHSKLMGEMYARSLCPNHLVLRVSWLYGQHGSNFVRTILRLATSGGPVRVVDDQTGSPTWTKEVVRQLAVLLQRDAVGIYHCSAHGACTWYEFALAILKEYDLDVPCHPISTSEFGAPAKRPAYSVLANRVLELEQADVMRNWRVSFEEFALEDRAGRSST